MAIGMITDESIYPITSKSPLPPDYPVHPEVIVDVLSEAAQRWGGDETEKRLE